MFSHLFSSLHSLKGSLKELIEVMFNMTLSPHGGLLINRFNPHLNVDYISGRIEIDDFTLATLDCIAD